MKNWKTINKKFVRPDPRYEHLTEENAVKAGESAFSIRVPIYNNPYRENHLKNSWIRGFKRAERIFMDGLRRSAKILETLPLEEIEA